jgi:hypothetical protein
MQEALGIIRLPDLELPTIRSATARAIELFDEKGVEGVLERHKYILDNHMLVHRVNSMLQVIMLIAQKNLSITFGGKEHLPFGLRIQAPQ